MRKSFKPLCRSELKTIDDRFLQLYFEKSGKKTKIWVYISKMCSIKEKKSIRINKQRRNRPSSKTQYQSLFSLLKEMWPPQSPHLSLSLRGPEG